MGGPPQRAAATSELSTGAVKTWRADIRPPWRTRKQGHHAAALRFAPVPISCMLGVRLDGTHLPASSPEEARKDEELLPVARESADINVDVKVLFVVF